MASQPLNEVKNGNGQQQVKSKMLEGVNVPTLLSILVMNGWNIGATTQTGHEQTARVNKALEEIHHLHENLDDFEARQKAILDYQTQAIKNQTRMLENQEMILKELHR